MDVQIKLTLWSIDIWLCDGWIVFYLLKTNVFNVCLYFQLFIFFTDFAYRKCMKEPACWEENHNIMHCASGKMQDFIKDVSLVDGFFLFISTFDEFSNKEVFFKQLYGFK